MAVVPGELVKEHIYTQVLKCREDRRGYQLDEDVNTYVDNVLNDPQRKVGVVFYKAQVYKSDNGQQFIINLYLFSRSHWTEEVKKAVEEIYLNDLIYKGMTLISEQIIERTVEAKRKPVYAGDDEAAPAWRNIPGKTKCQKFLNWWLIVPRAQWDFFDLLYQTYSFSITHQGFMIKFVHFFTIPCNAMLTMLFLAQFRCAGIENQVKHGALEINASMALLLILGSMYLIMGIVNKKWLWGLATTVVLFFCWMAGNLWYAVYKTPGNPWYNPTTLRTNPILWSYIVSLVQTGSHVWVPQIPPHITGVHHWEALHVVFFKKYQTSTRRWDSIGFIVMAFLCFPTILAAVTWFSWPHLIGTQVIFIMAGIGYEHYFFEKVNRVLEKAELSGNPCLDDFPTTSENLVQGTEPYEWNHQDDGLVKKKLLISEGVDIRSAFKLSQTFFKHGTRNC